MRGKTKIYRPGIRHYITAGAYLLRVDELYSEGAQPSAALRQVDHFDDIYRVEPSFIMMERYAVQTLVSLASVMSGVWRLR